MSGAFFFFFLVIKNSWFRRNTLCNRSTWGYLAPTTPYIPCLMLWGHGVGGETTFSPPQMRRKKTEKERGGQAQLQPRPRAHTPPAGPGVGAWPPGSLLKLELVGNLGGDVLKGHGGA